MWASLLSWQASQEGVHICLPKAACGPQAGHGGQLPVKRRLGCLRRCGRAEGLEAGRGAWGVQAGQLQGAKGVGTGRQGGEARSRRRRQPMPHTQRGVGCPESPPGLCHLLTSCSWACCLARRPSRASARPAAALEGPAPSPAEQPSAPVTRSLSPDMAGCSEALSGLHLQWDYAMCRSGATRAPSAKPGVVKKQTRQTEGCFGDTIAVRPGGAPKPVACR